MAKTKPLTKEEIRQRIESSILPDDPRINLDEFQTAKRMGVSVFKLRRDRWAGGGVRFLKIGGRVMYRQADIDSYEATKIRRSTSDGC